MTLRVIVLAVLASVASAGLAGGQTTHDNPFRFGTVLSGFAGGTADAEGAAPAAGLELGWEITHRFAIEGTTLWSRPDSAQSDFGVVIGPRLNLAHNRRQVPFITTGVGMYRASFDSLAGTLPPFYGDRLTGTDRVATTGKFDDFLASVGGGAEFFVHDHWAVRPDVRLMMVFSGSDTRWITTVGAHLAYHFEHHSTTD
jgi:hypothetical protein